MQTKKALSVLSKGQVKYSGVDTELRRLSARYLEQYKAMEDDVNSKKASYDVAMPFVDVIRRKVEAAVSTPHDELPIVTSFDLYTSVRRASNQSNQDAGLRRLAKHLEFVWQKDPLATLNYGNVRELITFYKDAYPASQAVAAIEASCQNAGLHKLPVAKLSRIASGINSQEDFDAAVKTNKLDGSKIEQVRSRSFIRSLVAMKTGETTGSIASKLAQLDMEPEEELPPAMESDAPAPMADEEDLPPELMEPGDDMGSLDVLLQDEPGAQMESDPMAGGTADGTLDGGELADGADIIEEINEVADEIVQSAPPEAADFIDHEQSEGHHTAPVGSPTWAGEEMLPPDGPDGQGHDSPPPSDEWLGEEAQELQRGAAVEEEDSDEPKSRGIPMPKGKVKSQPHVTTYAKAPKSIKATRTAAHIEDNLLQGKIVRVGKTAIRINAADEVELWHNGQGSACDLDYLDTAIADFMSLSGLVRSAQQAPLVQMSQPSQPEQPGMDAEAPIADIIPTSLAHYKQMGMDLIRAVEQLRKDFKDREQEFSTPEASSMISDMVAQLWGTSQMPEPEQVQPMSDMDMGMAPTPMEASRNAQKMKTPTIRKPKDKVKVEHGVGKDSETTSTIKTPSGKPKAQPNKPKGKLSPKELGEDSETRSEIPLPSGKPSMTHSPKDQPGVKLVKKLKLGPDSEGNEPAVFNP